MENLTAFPEQPKKTWVEPELAILNVEGGPVILIFEGSTSSGNHGSMS